MTGLSSDDVCAGVAAIAYHALSSSDEPGRAIPWMVALPHCHPPFHPVTTTLHGGSVLIQLSALFAFFTRRFELLVALRVYLALTAIEHVLGCHIANGGV